MKVLAWALNFKTFDDLIADLAKPESANAAVVKKVGSGGVCAVRAMQAGNGSEA
jgi:hypothetical protein